MKLIPGPRTSFDFDTFVFLFISRPNIGQRIWQVTGIKAGHKREGQGRPLIQRQDYTKFTYLYDANIADILFIAAVLSCFVGGFLNRMLGVRRELWVAYWGWSMFRVVGCGVFLI